MSDSKHKDGLWIIGLLWLCLAVGCDSTSGMDEIPTGGTPSIPDTPVILPKLKGLWLAEFTPGAYDPSNSEILADRLLLEVGDTTANLYFFYKTDQVGGQKSTYVQTADTLTLQGNKRWNSTNYWVDSTNVISMSYLVATEYLDLGLLYSSVPVNIRTSKQPALGFDTDLVKDWQYYSMAALLKPKATPQPIVDFLVSDMSYDWHEKYTGTGDDEIFCRGTVQTMGQYLYMQWLFTGPDYNIQADKLSLRKYSKTGSGNSMLLTVEGINGRYILQVNQ